MALEGTLRDFSFADILQLISLQRKTGVLTLKNEGNVVTISFLDGRIVGASSLTHHVEDRLGLLLLKARKLSEEQLEAALKQQEESLQRLGRILIDHAIVDPDDVRHGLAQQITQIIYRVFRWTDGEYHFSQETDIDFDEELIHPIPTDSIIMEGARMTDEWPFIDKRLPDRDVVLVQTDPERQLEVAEDEDDFGDLGFSFADSPEDKPLEKEDRGDRVSPTQLEAYESVNGRDSINDILLMSPYHEFDTCKALADLIERGFVRPSTPEEMASVLRREVHEEAPAKRRPSIPWLAIPFLVLLGLSFAIMWSNPLNPLLRQDGTLVVRQLREAASAYQLHRLWQAVQHSHYLTGTYPESLDQLVDEGFLEREATVDPWGQPYRLLIRGRTVLLTGLDAAGHPSPDLLLSHSLAWEGPGEAGGSPDQKGVILLPG